MSYTKLTWDTTIPMSTTNMEHLETQADELNASMLAVDHSLDYYTIAEYVSDFYLYPGGGAGSGQDADTLSGMTKAQLLAASVPSSSVIMWHGNIGSPPTGFLYCDGSHGAPDMRNRLPLGGDYNVKSMGGTAAKAWTGYVSIDSTQLTLLQLPRHSHDWVDHYPSVLSYCNNVYSLNAVGYDWGDYSNPEGGNGSHLHTGTLSGSNNNYPLSKSVYFLIKT